MLDTSIFDKNACLRFIMSALWRIKFFLKKNQNEFGASFLLITVVLVSSVQFTSGN